MSDLPESIVREKLDSLYRSESRRVYATLVRLLGDFDLAEDALQEAFRAALEQWPRKGIPHAPLQWLISAGRFKCIDHLRKRARDDTRARELSRQAETCNGISQPEEPEAIGDDRLRLIFTCCHPALPEESRIALTLRSVCGLSTEDIAHAFLVPPPTLAQRIVRAKARIRHIRIPYRVPDKAELPIRLATVLRVLYLVFNEGYLAASGLQLTRPDLSAEAIRLGRLLMDLLPEAEVTGLLALMLLQESRRAARSGAEGELITLEEQDRSLWNREQIAEGIALVERALSTPGFGRYSLQAAIAALHAEAAHPAQTDWRQILSLYDTLLEFERSPVVELNRAVAVAMASGPLAGIRLIDGILKRGDLQHYHLAHAARADLCRRAGRVEEARDAYRKALEYTRQESERRFLEGRLKKL